jgi:hypothetical protein
MKLICNNNRCNERSRCFHSVPHEMHGYDLCNEEYCAKAYRQDHSNKTLCEKVTEGFNPEEIISKAFKQGYMT